MARRLSFQVVLEWELKALPCAALLLDEETEDEEWAPTADDEAEEPVEEYDEGDAVTENGDDAASPQLCPSADVELLDELAGAEDEAEDETDDEFAASEEDDEEPAEEYDELDAEPEEEDEEEEEEDEEEDNEEELV